MNILLLTQFFSATRGGGEVLFYLYAKELAKRGHRIYIIKHKLANELETITEDGNLLIYKINPILEHKGGLPANFIHNLLYLINSVRLGKYLINKHKIDIIHANTYIPVFGGYILSKITRKPLVVTIHDVASAEGLNFWLKWFKQFGRLALLKSMVAYIAEVLTIKLPKHIYTVSLQSKNDISIYTNKSTRIYVIENGLDINMYNLNKSKSTDKNYIIFIGRLVFYKNIEIVLHALNIINNKLGKNIKFIIVGDGPMRKELEDLTKKLMLTSYVTFKGYVDHEEKLRLLSHSRLLVFPSTFEGFGMVILETWAFKKPVIVANVEPLCSIVKHGQDGFIADPYNAEEWASYILLLMEDARLADRLGLNGYNKLISNYTIEKAVDKLEDMYYNILSKA